MDGVPATVNGHLTIRITYPRCSILARAHPPVWQAEKKQGFLKNIAAHFLHSIGVFYAIQLKPEGSSYTANAEVFVSGTPLPLTDGMIGPDGALYFLTGGRKLESDLYRVYYGKNDS